MRCVLAVLALVVVGCPSPSHREVPHVEASVDSSVETSVLDASAEAEARDAVAPEGMLRVPGGTFTMGAEHGGEEDEHPAHAVTLSEFWLDRTLVTNERYAKCVAAHACLANDRSVVTRRHAGDEADFAHPQQPVVGVSWDDAKKFCAWEGKRLPREAELERAARGDDGRMYPWGNEPPTSELAAFARALGGPGVATDDVGMHPTGRGPYGHDDLAGNVWEWCEDAYDPYAYRRKSADRGEPGSCAEILTTQDELRTRGLEGFTGSNPIPNECERVLRGGAFNYDAHGLRSTNRVHHPHTFRMVMAGFRCAR